MKAIVYEETPDMVPEGVLPLVPGKNLVTGSRELAGQLGALSTLENDLLTVAASIFACDLAAKRGEREGFTRTIELSVPVVNQQAFMGQSERLRTILWLLSDDNWKLEFHAKPGNTEGISSWPQTAGKTLLFSGGLDSLAAAIDELEEGGTLQLASHYTRNQVIRGSQETLFEYLLGTFPDRISRISSRVTGLRSGALPFPSDADREPSQRTRSFVFLTIGALAARRKGCNELLMIAENGQMAIHLPLTTARIGAFSTHTAHPEVVHEIELFLAAILGFPLSITNPFLYRTKAECIAAVCARHALTISNSVSCWRTGRQALAHCGECVPCLIRRVSLEANGLRLAEYERDLLSEDIASLAAEDIGRRNLIELCEFITRFGPDRTDAQIEAAFPDLFNQYVDEASAISMYRRAAQEATQVFATYPRVAAIIG